MYFFKIVCITVSVFLSSTVVIAGFVNSEGNTVFDTDTGLVWQQADDNVGRSWEEAIHYCEDLNQAGYSDWRLPNKNELASIIDYTSYDPAIDEIAFSVSSFEYWSSTTSVNDISYAWSAHFGSASVLDSQKSNYNFVRCVRNGN